MSTHRTNAIFHNNDAVAKIKEGDFEEAISSLSIALRSSKASMAMTPTKLDQSNITLGLDMLMMPETKQDKGEKLPSDSDMEVDELDHRIYSTPIHIAEQYHSVTPTVVNDCDSIFSAVAIFNLALAYHLAGVNEMMQCQRSNPNKQSRAFLSLRKAAKLYQYAIQIQRDSCTDESSFFFILATLNNLGDTYYRLGEISTSEAYFERLLTILMFLVDSAASGGRVQLPLDMEIFFINTFHLVSKNQGNAAAAA